MKLGHPRVNRFLSYCLVTISVLLKPNVAPFSSQKSILAANWGVHNVSLSLLESQSKSSLLTEAQSLQMCLSLLCSLQCTMCSLSLRLLKCTSFCSIVSLAQLSLSRSLLWTDLSCEFIGMQFFFQFSLI